jgi:hypothetical protein
MQSEGHGCSPGRVRSTDGTELSVVCVNVVLLGPDLAIR